MKKVNNVQLGFNFESDEIQTSAQMEEQAKEIKKKEDEENKKKQKEAKEKKQKIDNAKKELKNNCEIAINYLEGKYDLSNIKEDTIKENIDNAEKNNEEDDEEENEEDE